VVDETAVRVHATVLLIEAEKQQTLSLDSKVGVHCKLLQQLATEEQRTEVQVQRPNLKAVQRKLADADLLASWSAQLSVVTRFAEGEEEGVDHRVALGFPGGQFARVLAASGVDSNLVPNTLLISSVRDNDAGNLTRGGRVVPEMNG